ncbi:hypothetical protein ACIRRH_43375 [Kitasatospora sp. NPDC101235]|uniref:hypothetical protein n=1 Tax=Kitasatospora sp. NPDC101235 TaxID=3364101 RepID=UPI00382D9920
MKGILVPLVVAVVTTVITGLVQSRVAPRTERWGGHYRAAVADRDRFRKTLETVRATGSATPSPPSW